MIDDYILELILIHGKHLELKLVYDLALTI
jgi:hypothetical protein